MKGFLYQITWQINFHKEIENDKAKDSPKFTLMLMLKQGLMI